MHTKNKTIDKHKTLLSFYCHHLFLEVTQQEVVIDGVIIHYSSIVSSVLWLLQVENKSMSTPLGVVSVNPLCNVFLLSLLSIRYGRKYLWILFSFLFLGFLSSLSEYLYPSPVLSSHKFLLPLLWSPLSLSISILSLS